LAHDRDVDLRAGRLLGADPDALRKRGALLAAVLLGLLDLAELAVSARERLLDVGELLAAQLRDDAARGALAASAGDDPCAEGVLRRGRLGRRRRGGGELAVAAGDRALAVRGDHAVVDRLPRPDAAD